MAISPELMLAILAMDSYNRGYNNGIGPKDIGLGLAGSQIGNATVNRIEGGTAAQAASFFAISYSFGTGNDVPLAQRGKTVISYRGTDTDFFFGADRPAFLMGAGAYNTTQGGLAVDFYKTVNGGNATTNSNITVVGHSLGGGLEGFVGSLYGLSGVTVTVHLITGF
jgi:hypothetical protein